MRCFVFGVILRGYAIRSVLWNSRSGSGLCAIASKLHFNGICSQRNLHTRIIIAGVLGLVEKKEVDIKCVSIVIHIYLKRKNISLWEIVYILYPAFCNWLVVEDAVFRCSGVINI